MGGFEDAITQTFGQGSPAARAPGLGSARRWTPGNAQLKLRALLVLIVTDLAAIVVGFTSVASVRHMLGPDERWLTLLFALLPVYLTIALSSHAFSAVNLRQTSTAIRIALRAFVLAMSVIILAMFFLKSSSEFPRLTIGLGSVLAALMLATTRALVVRNLFALIGGNPFSIVMICDGLSASPRGASTVIFASELDVDPDRHDPTMYDRLATALQAADRVIVSCPQDRREAWAHVLKGANIQSEIIASDLEPLSPLAIGLFNGNPTLVVANGPLGLVDRAIKRAFDITVAVAGLIAFGPIMLAIAVLVRLDSPGPALFRQHRIGRSNQLFEMLKFRSMRESDHHGGRSTARDDDRVTRIGRFIRSTSLDELPQLLNVLAGSMSIVGPRPHALGSRAADKLFWDIDGRYWHRHAIKPGLTGLAQVRGYRGATLFEDDLRNRLQADLEYLENWSIWRDLRIVVATLRVIVHRNAF